MVDFLQLLVMVQKNSAKAKEYRKLGYVSSYYELPETDMQLHLINEHSEQNLRVASASQ